MREQRFVATRRARWERLDAIVAQIDRRGLRRLTAAEIDELAFGYRAATSDLALARGRGYDERIVAYLNRLTARAHAYVYLGTSGNGWERTRRFAVTGFPGEVRRSWRPIAVCALLTIVCAAIAYRATVTDPANAYAFVPAEAVPLVDRSLHDSNFGFDRAFAPAMSALIITNNIKVSALAFAGGATGGILTAYVIATNGLDLGTIGALFARRGFGADFWATIAPHGAIELSAIQIAGGAGLILAAGILRPGRARRVDAFARNARRAGTLMLGVSGMLVVAGLIEGFVSPQRLSIELRAAVGALTALGLFAYFAFAGRSQEPARLDLDVGVDQGQAELLGRRVDHDDPALA
jgi:uncharacterized membrane protein SpoIIM required for sporulation